jgi:3-oxoacyl-[acyl-carrier-protein] synthase II
MRRVVVTGIGAITPLGVGIRRTWQRLLASECGIVSVADLEPQNRWRELPSTVAGVVPSGSRDDGKWQASDWLEKGEERRMARFTQLAVAATEMALEDAGWKPTMQEDKEATGVCLGSGIGNLEELYETIIGYEKNVSPSITHK